jgi:hypothetical protein
LEAASGTKTRTIHRLEAGKGVSPDSLRAVASALEVDLGQFLTRGPPEREGNLPMVAAGCELPVARRRWQIDAPAPDRREQIPPPTRGFHWINEMPLNRLNGHVASMARGSSE